MIGRIYSAHPGEGERFYLRMQLSHVTGCSSYEDIRTLPDGTVCENFKSAAIKRGLLDDDTEYDLILEECASRSKPPQLRQLFVFILLYNEPSDPGVLWEKYKDSFPEHFLFRARKSVPDIQLDQHILNLALVDIENRIQKLGKSLSDISGMPLPSTTRSPYEEALIIQTELDYNVGEQLEIVGRDVPSLNSDQRNVFGAVMAVINDPEPYIFQGFLC